MPERRTAAKDCPLAPSANASVYARTLHRACVVLGGTGQLAGHLGVSLETLLAWLEGDGQPDERSFLACVEIVLLHAENAGRAN